MLKSAFKVKEAAKRATPQRRGAHRNALAADECGVDIPLGSAVSARGSLKELHSRGNTLAHGRIGPGICRTSEQQLCGVCPGARGIERRLAQLVEPIGRRGIHRAGILACCSRRAAEFTNWHEAAPLRSCCAATECRLSGGQST